MKNQRSVKWYITMYCISMLTILAGIVLANFLFDINPIANTLVNLALIYAASATFLNPIVKMHSRKGRE